MTDTFNDPGSGSGDQLPIKELIGALLLTTVHEETDEITTVHGPSTAIRADVAVLDGDHKGEVFSDVLIFQRVLKSQLRSSIGGKVIGRLGYGEKKPGKDAPYRLEAATDADKAVGMKYLIFATAVATKALDDEKPF